MKDTLNPGIEYIHKFQVSANKTVSALYPEAEEFAVMPEVFATGFLVGLIEWACIKAVNPHLDWPREQTVGVYMDIKHMAATPPGFEVTTKVTLLQVEGKRLIFEFEAYDESELISRGRHERAVIIKEKFDARVGEKARNRRS